MIVVMDANVLFLALRPEAGVPTDPNTGLPITEAKDRVEFLIETLDKSKAQIVVPTPALAELLVRAGDKGPAIVAYLNKTSVFRIAPFDEIAAVELAVLTRAALDAGDKKAGSSEPWQKIKVDRQIVAIARVERASIIYTTDASVRSYAFAQGMQAQGVHELPLRPTQTELFPYGSHDEEAGKPGDTSRPFPPDGP